MAHRVQCHPPAIRGPPTEQEFREWTYRLHGDSAMTLDHNHLHLRCPLDNGRHDISNSTQTLGALEGFPAEAMSFILRELDVGSLTNFRAVNKRAMQLVNGVPEYMRMIRECPNVIRAVLSTRAPYSLDKIYATLSEWQCMACFRFGEYFYLVKCERVCYHCIRHVRLFTPPTKDMVASCTHDPEGKVMNYTGIMPVHGLYGPKQTEAKGNEPLYYWPDMEGCAHITVVEEHDKLAGKKNSSPLYYRNFMTVVSAPVFHNPTAAVPLEWGVNCHGCKGLEDDRIWRHWRTKYIRKTFKRHIEIHGGLIETQRGLRHELPDSKVPPPQLEINFSDPNFIPNFCRGSGRINVGDNSWISADQWAASRGMDIEGAAQSNAQPSGQSSEQPTGQPTGQPTEQPTGQPTGQPTEQPTEQSAEHSTGKPTGQPAGPSIEQPAGQSVDQLGEPSDELSDKPSDKPSGESAGESSSKQPTGQSGEQTTGQASEHAGERTGEQVGTQVGTQDHARVRAQALEQYSAWPQASATPGFPGPSQASTGPPGPQELLNLKIEGHDFLNQVAAGFMGGEIGPDTAPRDFSYVFTPPSKRCAPRVFLTAADLEMIDAFADNSDDDEEDEQQQEQPPQQQQEEEEEEDLYSAN